MSGRGSVYHCGLQQVVGRGAVHMSCISHVTWSLSPSYPAALLSLLAVAVAHGGDGGGDARC